MARERKWVGGEVLWSQWLHTYETLYQFKLPDFFIQKSVTTIAWKRRFLFFRCPPIRTSTWPWFSSFFFRFSSEIVELVARVHRYVLVHAGRNIAHICHNVSYTIWRFNTGQWTVDTHNVLAFQSRNKIIQEINFYSIKMAFRFSHSLFLCRPFSLARATHSLSSFFCDFI